MNKSDGSGKIERERGKKSGMQTQMNGDECYSIKLGIESVTVATIKCFWTKVGSATRGKRKNISNSSNVCDGFDGGDEH